MKQIRGLLLCGMVSVVACGTVCGEVVTPTDRCVGDVACECQGKGDVIAQGREIFTQACDQLKSQDLSSSDRAKIVQATKDVRTSGGTAFSEEELIAAMDMVLDNFDHKLTPNVCGSLNVAMTALARRLSKFKITGFAFAVDPNGAFFVDTQDPVMNVVFKNAAGEIKTKKIQADIESIGLKIQFSINMNFIFFIGTDLNYLDAHDVIELGVGGEISPTSILSAMVDDHFAREVRMGRGDGINNMIVPLGFILNSVGVVVTYASLKKRAGGLLMVSLCFGFPGGSLSVVTGGSLTPVED